MKHESRTRFYAKDFEIAGEELAQLRVSNVANNLLIEIKKAWLEELVKDARVVYALKKKEPHDDWVPEGWFETANGYETHTARLIDIKRIEK